MPSVNYFSSNFSCRICCGNVRAVSTVWDHSVDPKRDERAPAPVRIDWTKHPTLNLSASYRRRSPGFGVWWPVFSWDCLWIYLHSEDRKAKYYLHGSSFLASTKRTCNSMCRSLQSYYVCQIFMGIFQYLSSVDLSLDISQWFIRTVPCISFREEIRKVEHLLVQISLIPAKSEIVNTARIV